MNILFLPRWFPDINDPMTGLFIQRQAEALAQEHEVVVLCLYPDPNCPNKLEIDYAEERGVEVIRVRFFIHSGSLSLFFRPLLVYKYWQATIRGLEIMGGFKPDIVHSHILTRSALVGYWLSNRWRVPHVISEHWSRYFRENDTFRGIIRKWITRWVVNRASALIPVSVVLQEALHANGIHCPMETVIPNIVDTHQFLCKETLPPQPMKQFIHVSCFEEKAKNLTGLLEAIRLVKEQRVDFRCLLIGDGPNREWLQQKADQQGILGSVVHFVGMKEGEALSHLYQQSDFLVLCSRYETFGTVILESMSCGTPVLSTEVGIAPEVITADNGMLVRGHDPTTLARAINVMLDTCRQYDPERVSASVAGLFTPEAIANKFRGLYQHVIESV